MHREAWMLVEPLLDTGVFMCGVVVGDQVQRLSLGRFAVDFLQELQPLGVGVALLTLCDDFAVQNVERCKQGRRAVALVVVRHRLRTALFQWQAGLGTVERLHLTLLIAAQHQRMFRR